MICSELVEGFGSLQSRQTRRRPASEPGRESVMEETCPHSLWQPEEHVTQSVAYVYTYKSHPKGLARQNWAPLS